MVRDRPEELQDSTEICYRYVSPLVLHVIEVLLSILSRTRWVKLQGVEYREKCAVVIGVEDDDPVFAKVETIYVVDSSQILLQVYVLHTSSFYQHCHAYVIQRTHTHKLINVEDLHNPYPYCIRNLCILTHIL